VDSHPEAGMIRKVLNEDIAKGSAQAIDYSLYEPDGFAVEFSLTGFAAFSPSNGPCPSFEKWLKFAINLRAYRPWQLPPIEGSIRKSILQRFFPELATSTLRQVIG